MNFWSLTFKSLRNRRFSLMLTVASIAVGVALLIGIERLRTTTEHGFESTISQTDLIVGARGAPLQVLLYAVFHIGNALNNIRYSSFEKYASSKEVAWAVPISLGDSHKGFRVVGTSKDYFKYVKVGDKKSLTFQDGKAFDSLFDVVIGADVAETLHYGLGKKIILAHGVGAAETFSHDNAPFTVVGILGRTGTPIDRSVLVSLDAIEAIHSGWQSGAPTGTPQSAEELLKKKWHPSQITAFYIGLKSRMSVFQVQRAINDDTADEALTALLPGIVLRDLWNTLGKAQVAFRITGIFVLLSNLLNLLLVMLSSLNERRREMAIYRALGSSPRFMGRLLLAESFLVTLAGIFVGYALLAALLFVASSYIELNLGFPVPIISLSQQELIYLVAILVAGTLCAVIPAQISTKHSLSDGLTIRV